MVYGVIKEMLTKLIEEEEGEKNTTIKEEPSCEQSQLSGLELLLEDICVTEISPAEKKADLELSQYQFGEVALFNYCASQWWAEIVPECLNLSRLARRYNWVPACCLPTVRISVETRVLYDEKRAALPPHLADKLLFLHGNHNV